MSVEIGCECDDLPAHSHVYLRKMVTNTQGRIVGTRYRLDEFDVRVWVDWKAVARALSQETTPESEATDVA